MAYTFTAAQKLQARQVCILAVRGGSLVRQPCEKCGAEKTEAHHEDYSKPFDVRWLCRACHLAAHWKTHCRHGHPRTPDNLYTKDGRRDCKQCHARRLNDRKRRRRQLNKADGSRT